MPKKESEKRKGIVAEYKAKFDVMRNGILESINNVSPSGVILLHNLQAAKVAKKFDGESEEARSMSNKQLAKMSQDMLNSKRLV